MQVISSAVPALLLHWGGRAAPSQHQHLSSPLRVAALFPSAGRQQHPSTAASLQLVRIHNPLHIPKGVGFSRAAPHHHGPTKASVAAPKHVFPTTDVS